VAALARLAAMRWPTRRSIGALAAHGTLAAAVALPAVGVVVLRDARYLDLSTKPNAVTDYLVARSGVTLGSPYRGVVASFIGTHGREAVSQVDLYAYVWQEMQAFNHNDLAGYGLWTFQIPTLSQFSVMMTPQYYLMLSELLARPADRQARSFAIITTPDERILKLWGVRYVVADYRLPFGAERISMPVVQMPEWYPRDFAQFYRGINFDSPVRVFELDGPNLGTYSPTGIIEVATAREVVERMRDPAFDGARSVIVTEPLAAGLVPATRAAMTVERGGIDVAAASPGQSVLVLPVQYSHCWRLEGGPGTTLFRANLMQLGIRFTGEIKVRLRQVFGPLWHSHCRIEDARDMERLDISGARS
jgi:hypothetical protein